MTTVTTTARPTDDVVPPAAYMLADHLDAALAAGEDILAAGRQSALAARDPIPGVALRSVVELVRDLELALTTRVMKSREWSATLVKADKRFSTIASLFVTGTHPLKDALAGFADATDADFATGDGIIAYFRSRGSIDAEAVGLPEDKGAALISERFLLAGRIDLGTLLDLIAAYLDALEAQFELFHAPERAAHTVVDAAGVTVP